MFPNLYLQYNTLSHNKENNMWSIYQRTHNGTYQLFPYTTVGQFKSYYWAQKYLQGKAYNAKETCISTYSLNQINRVKGEQA